MIETVCKNCGNKKSFNEDKLGKKFKCPNCMEIVVIEENTMEQIVTESFNITAPITNVEIDQNQSNPIAENKNEQVVTHSLIQTICRNCGNEKSFSADKLGKKFKCPKCFNIVVIEKDTNVQILTESLNNLAQKTKNEFEENQNKPLAENTNEPILTKSLNSRVPLSKFALEENQSNALAGESKQNIKNKTNRSLYIILGVIVLLIFGAFAWYEIVTQKLETRARVELEFKAKAKMDSLFAAASGAMIAEEQRKAKLKEYQESIAASQKVTLTLANNNKDEIANKIYKYYEDLQLNKLDVSDYFAAKVNRFITKTNTTPSEINNFIISSKEEFSKSESILDKNTIRLHRTENGINYYSYRIHYKCFRTSKQKTEDCDVTVEMGVNQSKEFVSLVQTKIENLKFY